MNDNMNSFGEMYKNYTTAELLNIIRSENEYQAEAVQAALMILEERNVTEVEIAEELKHEETEQEENEQSTDEVLVKRTAKSVFRAILNPFIPSENDEEKNKNIIAILCIYMGVVYLGSLPTTLHTSFEMFTEHISEVLSQIDFIVIAFLPFISVILLYKGYKTGWCLFVLTLVFKVATAIAIYIRTEMTRIDIPFELNYWEVIGNVYHTVFNVCFNTGIVAILCTKGIRNLYGIDTVFMKNCLIISLFISILFYILR